MLESESEAPPGGAGPLNATVTTACAPPGIVEGVMVNELIVGTTTGATVAFAVLLVEL